MNRVLAAVTLLLLTRVASADVQRYAVIIGHNAGAADEQKLRFAETDAARVAELLGEVGGIPDENQVVLRSKNADQVRRALIATNERIRTEQQAGHDTMLFVYYSGHGDADALHLGDSRLALRELEALVRGSSASVRVLVIDSCRSGTVTRVKGGKADAPLELSNDVAELPGEGVIVLTASTAGEDAQESDDLGGSFFTHYLISALRGAADDNSDQLVTVAEAFGYTREQTILASSRTLSGTQHPTFHYDLRGRADVTLSELGAKGRGRLTLPSEATWLVIRPGANVVGEITTDAKRRSLSLRPGKYQVRGRTREALLEGSVTIEADRETVVDTAKLERSTYAHLVRKGKGDILGHVAGPILGPMVQTSIIDGASLCAGGMLGWMYTRADVTISPRLAGCRGTFENRTLDANTDALALDLQVAKAWDLSHVTLALAITGGAEILRETFDTRGIAPTRISAAGHIDAGGSIALPIVGRTYVTAELAAQTHFLSIEQQDGMKAMTARFTLRTLLAVGVWL